MSGQHTSRRIAWFSPVPPARTGVAAVTAQLVPVLRGRGDSIDVYTDALSGPGGTTIDGVDSAHDFVWRHLRHPYDLVVYQLGNSSHHEYAWAYALKFPGLIVLHDTRLHHARASQLLRDRRASDYRAELAFDEPGASRDSAELAVAGLDSCLYYDWTMVRALVETATLVAVHGEGTRRELVDALQPSAAYDDRLVSIRLGHGERLTPEREQRARRRVRQAYGIDADAVVFGVFGGLTPEKRIPQILKAFGAIAPMVPSARLLLVGAPAAYYDLMADVASARVQERVTITGYLESDDDLTDHLAACDVSVNLRWPTARETSGPWLRALAAGRATIITDLVHLCDVPSLDPRTWTVSGRDSVREPRHPVCVSIDILDEDHSLRLAMRRLAQDATLRVDLGRAAAEWWQREHSIEAMAADYERVIRQAMQHSASHEPSAALPPHMRNDGRDLVQSLLEPFNLQFNLQRDTL